jgi:hypothetical protein
MEPEPTVDLCEKYSFCNRFDPVSDDFFQDAEYEAFSSTNVNRGSSSVNFLRTKINTILIHDVATYSDIYGCQDTREQAAFDIYRTIPVRPTSVKITSPTVTGYPRLLVRFFEFSVLDIAMIGSVVSHDECPKSIYWYVQSDNIIIDGADRSNYWY